MTAGASGERPRLRLAELLAAVSLATDMADDAPLESALGDALCGLGLARVAGLSGADLVDVYYLALLYHLGCTAAADAQERMAAGAETGGGRWFAEADYADREELLRLAVPRAGRTPGAPGREEAVRRLMTRLEGSLAQSFAAICEVGARLGERLGAGPRVVEALDHAYARWDGEVYFLLPSRDGISYHARLVHLVHVARVYARAGGRQGADQVVHARRGAEFDPELSDLWLAHSGDLLSQHAGASMWEMALEAEPDPHRLVPESHVDLVTSALGDFAELKSSQSVGHGARVAELAEAAGIGLGLDAAQVRDLRRAARVHDLGYVSVPNRVWDKEGPLSPVEQERVRLHPYHTERVLAVAESLRPIGTLAGMHHERLDGSGYHRCLPAAAIPTAARVLAVAEAYQSMTEERPWRPPLSRSDAASQLWQEVRDGKLDRLATEAVLDAAGQPRTRGREARTWPRDLTDREVEVLRLVARGRSNREIATALHVADGTVHTHIINVYSKIEVKTRAGAALFALEHDLIQL
ncbi:MAG: HD domain-containing phosphohydrolase [Candidatus Dormibacteria bacterium]